jgi:non-ribosomal peptide synthase protein (TIGR01720 family)
VRRIPARGIGYGLLRYLSNDPEVARELRGLPKAEVNFNYLGRFDRAVPAASPFRLAREGTGPTRSPRGRRQHLLEVSAVVIQDSFHAGWIYSEQVHRRSTIEAVAQAFMEGLRSLVRECRSGEGTRYSASDFPLVDLDQGGLDEALRQIDFE